MRDLTETQIRILEELARYKFLTAAQMVRLGITSQLPSIYRASKPLTEGRSALVGKKEFPPTPGLGRPSAIYYLRDKGARFLTDALHHRPDRIRMTKNTQTLFARDYTHRIQTLDFHIAWSTYAAGRDFETFPFVTYFDFEGSNHGGERRLRAQTRMEVEGFANGFIVPDAHFGYRDPATGRDQFFLVEIARKRDTGYIMRQILGHAMAINQGSSLQVFHPKILPRVLYVFEIEGTMKSAVARFRNDPNFGALHEWFAFGTIDDAVTNFESAWRSPDGQRSTFFGQV